MGQILGCRSSLKDLFVHALVNGDVDLVKKMIRRTPRLLSQRFSYRLLWKHSCLHLAVLHGHAHIVEALLELGADVDVACFGGKSPLMVACKKGKADCVEALLKGGANILVFESCNGRTCLHYAATGSHPECVEKILGAARNGPVEATWGFSRFVNVKDNFGATPLHVAARVANLDVCRLLLDAGALVSSTTSVFGYGWEQGCTPLHSAARGGSVEVVRELIAWGADRTQTDLMGDTPYEIALRHYNIECARVLDPDGGEPMVWPSPWKCISNLEPQTKLVLRAALDDANNPRRTTDASSSQQPRQPNEVEETSVMETCSICFEKMCSIEVEECGHQMCASCTLAVCCHNKPNPGVAFSPPPCCPFCRSSIGKLVLAKPKVNKEQQQLESAHNSSRRFRKRSRSFGRISWKGSGRIMDADLTAQLHY